MPMDAATRQALAQARMSGDSAATSRRCAPRASCPSNPLPLAGFFTVAGGQIAPPVEGATVASEQLRRR